MRKFISFLVVFLILCIACDNVETNTASLQVNIDEFFFKADATVASKHQDNSYTITATTNDQTLILHVDSPAANEYPVGGASDNWATYEDENGNIYSSVPDGEGAIIVTSWDTSYKTLTGEFAFKLVLPGIDTLQFSNGMFYEVPYGFGVVDNVPQSDGNVIGKIDGVSFSPVTVNATNTGNNIVIVAVGSNYTITLTFPNDITTGNYNIPSGGITATLSNGTTSETAIQGITVVVEHDTDFKVLRGTFSFETENHQVTVGQYNVSYE